MRSLKNYLINLLVEEEVISKDQIDLYEYGLILGIEFLVSIILGMSFSFITGNFHVGLLFYIVMIPLRKFCGGLHFDSGVVCQIVSFMMLVVTILVYHYIKIDHIFSVVATLLMALFTYIISPIENKNKPLQQSEKIKLKSTTKKILIFIMIVDLNLFLINSDFIHLIFIIVLLNAISAFGGMVLHNVQITLD